MNITKNVTNIIGQMLEKEGFSYHKDYETWEFKRKKNDFTQNIVVLRHRYFAGQIKVLFYTATSGMKEFRDFVPEVNIMQEFWEYNTEKELREVLEQFREWIEKYGLDFLDSISTLTTEARGRMEANQYLYEHHKEIYESYCDKWEIKDRESLEIVQLLNRKIKEIYDRDFEEVKNLLIEYAAIYGHACCIENQGEWIWDEEKKMCVIKNVGGSRSSLEPINIMVYCHTNQSDFLLVKFKEVLRFRNLALKKKRRNK